jgi:hypothetical protein
MLKKLEARELAVQAAEEQIKNMPPPPPVIVPVPVPMPVTIPMKGPGLIAANDIGQVEAEG